MLSGDGPMTPEQEDAAVKNVVAALEDRNPVSPATLRKEDVGKRVTVNVGGTAHRGVITYDGDWGVAMEFEEKIPPDFMLTSDSVKWGWD